jgi:phosphate transport system permease protein
VKTLEPERSSSEGDRLPRRRSSRRRLGDVVFRALSTTAGLVVFAVLVIVTAFLLIRAWPALRTAGIHFFTEKEWFPDAEPAKFGVAALVWGTVMSSVVALTIALPVAIGVALYSTQYATPFVGRWIGYLIELLAAVPSVVYGLWGVLFLVPRLAGVERWLARHAGFIPFFSDPNDLYGRSIFAASVILALMVLPIVAAVAREVFRLAPLELREGALGLGATRWEMIRMVVLPFGRSGLIGAAVLGLGRALGETIAVALVLSATFTISPHILVPGGNTIAANIATKFGESGSGGRPALIASGLLLFGVTLVVTLAARTLVSRRARLLEELARP